MLKPDVAALRGKALLSAGRRGPFLQCALTEISWPHHGMRPLIKACPVIAADMPGDYSSTQ